MSARELRLKLYGNGIFPKRETPGLLHSHSYFQIEISLHSTATLLLTDRRQPIPAGTITVLPPGVEHGFLYTAEAPFEALSFKFDLARDPGLREARVIRDGHRGEQMICAIRHLFLGSLPPELRRKRQSYSVGTNSGVLQPLEGLLFGLLQYYCFEPEEGKRNRLVFALREFVRRRNGDPVTVEEAAAHLGYSPGHLLALVRAATGDTVKHLIDLERIEIAKTYLEYGSMNVAEIAQRFGFCDALYFGKFFRKYTGMPPGKYLREHR